jgi:hypothetical protein
MTEGLGRGTAVAISAKNGDLPALQARDARFQSSGVPFQGGGGPSRTFRAETAVEWRSSCASVYGMRHSPLGENKVKNKTRGRLFLGECGLRVCVRA